MSLKENNPEITPGKTTKAKEKTEPTHSYPESSSSGESERLTSSSKTQMENTVKNTKVTTAENSSKENSTKRSAESNETKRIASGNEDTEGKAKDASPSEDTTGVLAEGFCGFEDTETPILTRSTREASKNATAILTKKSTSKLERAEGKSDSPPDLVLFLKEGRGRAQNYSDPPRLDPESIATRRRTRVPEDPVALVSRAKSALSVEKAKKDQKEIIKKEKKIKVMETPESLKRLARDGSKQMQASGKDSSDSGTEEKTLKKTYSKGSSESDSKVRSMGSTGPEEEQLASISRRSNRGKRNSTDEPEVEVIGETVRTGPPAKDSPDAPTNYSNLGNILNKMTKNNADRRIPVVIMSKSEKGSKIDSAKPKSKKKVSSDKNASTAVLKIASAATPTFLAVRSSGRDYESSSKQEEDSKTSKLDDNKCATQPSRGTNSDSEAGQDVIVLKVTSDTKTEEKKAAKTKDRTVNSTSGEGSSSLAEKLQMRQNILVPSGKEQAKTDIVSGMKEATVSGSSQPAVLRAVQGSSSSVKINSASSPIRSGLVPPPIKPSLVISSVRPNSGNPPIRPKQVTSPIKSSAVMSHVKANLITSSIKSNPAMSSIKSGPVTSPIKSGPVTSPIKSGPITSPIKSGPITSPIKSGTAMSPIKSGTVTSSIKSSTVTSPIKSGTVTSPIKSGSVSSIKSGTVISPIKSGTVTCPLKSASVMSPIKYGSTTAPIKSCSVTSSNPQNQKTPPFVVSMSQIVSFGGVKGSVKMTNFTPSKMGPKVSTKGTSTVQNLKRDIAPKQESCTNTLAKIDPCVGGVKSQGSQASTHQVSSSASQKGPMLDYTDIETQEVVLGESEDSNGQVDGVGDMPAEADLLAHEELESSSEEDTIKLPERSIVAKKESLSPEGRVALDHSYSSGGSASSRKKSPSTYEKSLTPRPVYSNASTAKRSLDIMLHNDKINILRQMSQIFNDEKPPQQIFSDEKAVQPDADITVSSSDGEDEEANVAVRKTKENIIHMGNSKTSKDISTDSAKKGISVGQTAESNVVDENNTFFSDCTPSKPSASDAVSKPAGVTSTSADDKTSSEGTSSSSNKENSFGIQFTPPVKGKKEGNASEDAIHVGSDSPFLGFPDPDPKVHHVPAYSLSLNEKILVQNKVGPAGEMIDIVDGFSFTSFASEQEMMSYDGTYSGKSSRTHRQWLKKKRRKHRKRLLRRKGIRPMHPKVPEEDSTSNVDSSAASPKDKGTTADSGAFARVTEEGVSKIDEEEMLEPSPPPQSQMCPRSPDSPHSSPSPHSLPSPHLPHAETMPTETQAVVGVNPNTSAMEQHSGTDVMPESVDQYEEVNAIDILYPKEKYKYYYNKELCKETKADGSDVFVRRAGKLVPLTTVLKSQKCPAPEVSTKKSVELVYVYDGGKLLTLGGSLTKINPSNSDSVRARVVLPNGVPPIPRGEMVASRAKKVQAVEINEDMAKFALSALQSSHLKLEQTVDKKDDSAEECPPVSGPSSITGKDEKMEVDIPEATPVEKSETAALPKAVPFPVPIKPTKTNILDIIAAKLAMSDEESDGKEETEEKEATGDLKEGTTKPTPMEDKEESGGAIKEENKNGEIELAILGNSENSEIPLVKQEDLKEEKSEDTAALNPQVLEKGEAVEPKSEVKQEGEAQAEILLIDAMDDKVKEKDKLTPSTEAIDLVNLDGKEEEEKDKSEPLIVEESNKTSKPEQLTENHSESDVTIVEGKIASSEPGISIGKEKEGEVLSLKEKDCVSDVDSEKECKETEPMVSLEKEKEVEPLSSENKDYMSKVSEKKYENELIKLEEEGEESKLMTQEENKGKSKTINLEEDDIKSDVVALEKKDLNEKAASSDIENEGKTITLGEEGSNGTNTPVNLKEEKVAADIGAETKEREDSSLNEIETETEAPSAAEVLIHKTSANPLSETCKDETQGNISGEDNLSPPESVVNVPNDDTVGESPKSTMLSSSQESGERIELEEKEESPEFGTQDTLRMDIKSRVFKKNMYRFPSLSREMKRLNMNFVNYEPPHETFPEKKEEFILEVKEDCKNEHCKLGCVCDSLLCQRKSVEHCGRVECMFDCTCRDESWKLPSGSGRTMNAVSIFNLDREQKEGLALREKDFRRTVIQTGSEVILVGAERKKREIRLPGRYRETTVWTDSDMTADANSFFEPPDFSLQPDYPGIPLSEASKYIKKFKLNIPWYDIKGISVWCMDHSCYDCRCLTDPAFNDPIKVESPRKNTSSRVKPEPSILKSVDEPRVLKSVDEPSPSTLSALIDFEEALKQKASSDAASSSDDKELKKISFVVADANCSIMNIIVNNSETRRKYTWKLKEWYHYTEDFCARTAGYTKKKITEETKNMTLTGLAARDTTPEQIVESVVRSLRQQKSGDELKLPALPCSNNFEPFMGDSLTNLQNAIGLNPDNTKKPTRAETSCPLVDLTSGNEEISSLPKHSVKPKKSLPQDMGSKVSKDLKGVIKRRLSGSFDPPPKKAHLTKSEEAQVVQKGNSTKPSFLKSHQSNSKEYTPYSELKLPKKTLSLLEMMIAEENRGELELDLSNNIPGNAILVAEARFRKLINMNIIGVIGINKAGRCIIGTVDSDEALQVMHQIQNMIRNNTLDVGPNMREIFFPPPYVGIRPRYVMIRCDSHHKWEIVGVVQKKGPMRPPNKASELKAKANSSSKPQVPQVIDLEEEEREKQLLGSSDDMKQEENIDIVEPPSPEEKDGGDWEGSLPLIASVYSASDSNMAELIGSPEAIQEEPEEPEEPQAARVTPDSLSYETSPSQKALPDLVPITSSSSVDMISHKEEQADSLSVEAQVPESENVSQQKLYFVPTAFNVSSATTTTVSSIPTDTPMKSITVNVASNKIFGNKPEKSPSSPRPFSYGKVSYILPKLPGSGKNDSSTLSSQQRDIKNPAISKAEEGCNTDSGQAPGTPASPSSKMLYIPVTTGCVSKVLFVPTASGGPSSRMMLLPTLPGTSSLESSSTSSFNTTTTTSITTPIINSTTTATITTSKMKMVLVPSPQDSNKMLLIPATPDSSDSAAASSALGNPLAEGERKKMLVLPSSVINNFMSRTASSEPASTQPYHQSCTGTLFVPLPNTGNLPNTTQLSEKEKSTQVEQGDSHSQDSSDDVVVIGPTTNSLTITRMRTSSESCAVREETPSLFISPAPIASSSGVAETNVVSSLTTISSTMQENVSSPEVKSESISEVPSPVKQSIIGGLNTLFDKTHEEMVSYTNLVEEGLSLKSAKEGACEDEREDERGQTKVIPHSQNSNTGKTKDAQDQKKQLLIKKGGFHWSAVDLSLNFKSVKLEWLLGTIRKNVLMNIYQMSKKTHSPVTLSVKNGTSTSMLYGFARTCKSSTLPILILGSVVSAVLSSSSVPDSMLFQINSIKYFIRESTGELSSYTYSSETHLVKLASKKRGNAGEMVGIGEKIEIYKMRDPAYQSHSEKGDVEAGKAHASFSSAGHTGQAKGGCSCTEAGYFMCLGNCMSASSSKRAVAESTPSEDISSRASLENDSLLASLGFQDFPVASIHHQEGDSHSVKSKFPTSTKKHHSELRHLLTKPKGQSRMKKALLDINTEGLIAYSNEDDCQAIATKRSTPVRKDKVKARRESYTFYNAALRPQSSENYEESVVPKTECESGEDEGDDIDVLGDTDSSQTILSDLRQQLEQETTQVQKIANSFTSSKEFGKRKVLKMPHGGPPLKKARTGVSPSGVQRPCPRSRKASVSGKAKKVDLVEVVETSSKEEYQDKDIVDPSSRCPSHLAHLRPSAAGDSPVLVEENDSDNCILSKGKMSSLNVKQSQLMAALSRTKQKDKLLLDGDGPGDERNTEVHNKLERMRRKVMRLLFMHLQKIIVKVPRNPLLTRTVTHPKKTVLCAGQKVCEILKNEEHRLTLEEEKVRNERSALIKHLAAIIGESTEEIKVKWRNWVRDHMRNPTAKPTFESTWQPFRLEEDILKNAIEDNTFDMDYDEGSPLPEGSPVPGPSSPQGSVDKFIPQKTKRLPGKKIFKKRGKKLGRPHKIVVTTSNQGVAFSSETPASIPTSILLMAGTSSRGRKIVRKEDTNFVMS